MKVTKKTSVAGAYAKKEAYSYEGKDYEADIQNGDKVELLNSGDTVSGEYGDQMVFQIKTRNGEKNATFNQSSINALIEAFGDETEDWKGKEVNVLTKKGVYGGKKAIASYFVPEGWYLDDFGDLVKNEEVVQTEEETPKSTPEAVDPDAEEINPEDIPF